MVLGLIPGWDKYLFNSDYVSYSYTVIIKLLPAALEVGIGDTPLEEARFRPPERYLQIFIILIIELLYFSTALKTLHFKGNKTLDNIFLIIPFCPSLTDRYLTFMKFILLGTYRC